MTETLPFYIDFKSPYAYLAIAPTRLLERDFDVKLDWMPLTLNIPDYLDAVETRRPHAWRRVRYSYMDARRLANKVGLTVLGPKKIFDTRIGSIALMYAKGKPDEVAQRAYDAVDQLKLTSFFGLPLIFAVIGTMIANAYAN